MSSAEVQQLDSRAACGSRMSVLRPYEVACGEGENRYNIKGCKIQYNPLVLTAAKGNFTTLAFGRLTFSVSSRYLLT